VGKLGEIIAFGGSGFLTIKEATLSGLFFTEAPNQEDIFQVGDRIEVLCDHDVSGDRVRDWLDGTIVQVDPKMIAVQFQQNVYLTDGPKDSPNIRKVSRKRRRTRPRP
jgi:hypothetical protein